MSSIQNATYTDCLVTSCIFV